MLDRGTFGLRLAEHAGWRTALTRELASFGRFLAEAELADADGLQAVESMRQRLGSDRLVLAFVAEFSRGKTELINALFFGDHGRRLWPATPGRTTMCPVELRHDADAAPGLWLLPIESRQDGGTLAEAFARPEAWHHVPLEPGNAASLAAAFGAVTETATVTVDLARELGFWNDEEPEQNPPRAPDGSVQVPRWRHARVNHPHPMLQRGLVVLDTPGLNAIGAEPELTLALLGTADAAVFVLAADTGVTRSELGIWREQLGRSGLERFVVLNKIDTLADPLATRAEVVAAIERQRQETARLLDLPPERVFPLSARDALAARIGGDGGGLAASRLPDFEAALARELLPRHRDALGGALQGLLDALEALARQRAADRSRALAEQLIELRGLRGKSQARVGRLVERAEGEAGDFERCAARLTALRSVQQRMLAAALACVSGDALRAELAELDEALAASALPLSARKAFAALCKRLHETVASVREQGREMQRMLEATFLQLNAEFGFAFRLPPPPELAPAEAAIRQVEEGFGGYLTLQQAWRFASPGFGERLRRMLKARLRLVFQQAADELEQWSRGATTQVEQQLRDRRSDLARRLEALRRIQAATGELETRIAELEAQDAEGVQFEARLAQRLVVLRRMLASADSAEADQLLPGEITIRLVDPLPAAAAGSGHQPAAPA